MKKKSGLYSLGVILLGALVSGIAKGLEASSSPKCKYCGGKLKKEDDFAWVCTECGCYSYGNKKNMISGSELYELVHGDDDDEEDDDYEEYYQKSETTNEKPGVGCRACGNPDYPKCKWSCNLIDE